MKRPASRPVIIPVVKCLACRRTYFKVSLTQVCSYCGCP